MLHGLVINFDAAAEIVVNEPKQMIEGAREQAGQRLIHHEIEMVPLAQEMGEVRRERVNRHQRNDCICKGTPEPCKHRHERGANTNVEPYPCPLYEW